MKFCVRLWANTDRPHHKVMVEPQHVSVINTGPQLALIPLFPPKVWLFPVFNTLLCLVFCFFFFSLYTSSTLTNCLVFPHWFPPTYLPPVLPFSFFFFFSKSLSHFLCLLSPVCFSLPCSLHRCHGSYLFPRRAVCLL